MSLALRVHPEVRDALLAGRPVVALESTVLSHGLPQPLNLETGLALEASVREGGAVPATVGLLGGRVCVGLTPDELERLTRAGLEKVSLWNLPALVARGASGGTTVAATAHLAHLGGLEVFATGGIGGVHRGGEASLDVSADLHELRRSGVAVVCSGAKMVLDLPRTLELLETLGVPVVGYGTGDFPAFYVRASGLPVARVDDVPGLAAVVAVQAALGWPSGLVVANPPPADLALPEAEVEAMLGTALAEARAGAARGKDETPFLLRRLAELSGGRTVRLNEALVLANARLAAALAVALAGSGETV
jgi:pseudouridine-5'-phosphate glycosidase